MGPFSIYDQRGQRRSAISPHLHKPTDKWIETVKALRDLIETEGVDSGERAFAEAIGEARYWRRVNNTGMYPKDGPACAHVLLGEKCPPAKRDEAQACFPPGSDHVSLWYKAEEPVALVSEPYQLSYSALRGILRCCDENGLTVRINAQDSLHFPGRTLYVEYRPVEPAPLVGDAAEQAAAVADRAWNRRRPI